MTLTDGDGYDPPRMRAYLIALFVAFSVVSFVGPADAQMGPPNPALRKFGEKNTRMPDQGLKLPGILFLAGLGLVTFLGATVFYKWQAKDLEIPEDEAALAAAAPRGVAGVSPLETLAAALGRTEGWVTPGRVALSAGVDRHDAEELLKELVKDGRAKAGRDKQGRVLYRSV